MGVSPGWVFQIRSESKIFYTGHEARPVETLRVRGTRAPTLFWCVLCLPNTSMLIPFLSAADKFALATLNLEEAPAGYQIAYPCNNGASELEQSV